MNEKHIKVVKPTRDGKFWAMGLVVDTLDEALERCERKGKSNNVFLVLEPTVVNGLKSEHEIPGSPEYIRTVWKAIKK